MNDLFDVAISTEIRNRIASLRPESEGRWGVMNVAQMLAHCSAWMEMALGMTSRKQVLLGRLFGRLAKQSVLGAKPIRQNMPTDRSLAVADCRDFAMEQRRLLERVEQFSSGGPERCTRHPHSFFGLLTPAEWALMGYKHLDHHLRQFGV